MTHDSLRKHRRSPEAPAANALELVLAADGAKTLSRRLRGDAAGLDRFLYEQGPYALETIIDVLRRHMIDGRKTGSIRSWSYFMARLPTKSTGTTFWRHRNRPGDVFSAHRDLPCTPQERRQREKTWNSSQEIDPTTEDADAIIVF